MESAWNNFYYYFFHVRTFKCSVILWGIRWDILPGDILLWITVVVFFTCWFLFSHKPGYFFSQDVKNILYSIYSCPPQRSNGTHLTCPNFIWFQAVDSYTQLNSYIAISRTGAPIEQSPAAPTDSSDLSDLWLQLVTNIHYMIKYRVCAIR